jgi:hypothetical protein
MNARLMSTTMARAFVVLALVLGATALTAKPARAELVEVTTALDVADARDAGSLKAALQQAVERVVKETIAFEPTMIALTDARLMGERLLVRLLIADADGEQMLKDLQRGGGGENASPDEEEGETREIRV